MTDPRERRITARAFELWQAEGSLDGRSLSHWLQAEKEVDEELAEEPLNDQAESVGLAGAVNPH
ncbi:DUF2934 domain-containing protein [Shinella curvata]|uniref:DUF2934 domain-containing protein n=1 Tax=Shinella curvata TaxID=1817964 RepID=A0ABT8X9R2_9HYPH|nr:DUF2934 domain-containing protein [Shinella curvata]MCJ8051700.1 DUF2934 domain-containing protein [Shinella curvata]MDO6120353.1 DUF2934 domain-containing protein [Shinella curvata]